MTDQQNTEEVIPVQAWFIVVIDVNGNPVVLTEFPDANIQSERAATMQDVRRACSEVLADIHVKSVAVEVAAALAPTAPETPAEKVARKIQDRAGGK